MHAQDRWRIILEQLKANKVTSVEELTEKANASPATIRRDLNELQMLGRLKRVRGGATPVESDIATQNAKPIISTLDGQSIFTDSLLVNSDAKTRIAQKALSYIDDFQSVIIDGGSTTYMMASMIPDNPIQVLTNSIPIIQSLLGKSKIKLIIPGGEFYRDQQIILNPFNDYIIENFFAKRCFIGAQAITRNGLMQTDSLFVQAGRKIIEQTEEVILLADSSKFTSSGSLAVCSLDKITTLITDSGISEEHIKMITEAGVNLEIV